MTTFESTVYVVDDDLQVLKAITRLLRASGFHVQSFSSSASFLEQHDPAAPGCIVLDLAMPVKDGLELQRELSAAASALPIIFLTGRADIPTAVTALKQGAMDLLTKPVEGVVLVNAVRKALNLARAAMAANDQIAEIRRRLATLTPREFEVLGHVIDGKLNKETASQIGAAEKTVKIHRARVMEKMMVDSVAALVRLTDHAGVVPDLSTSWGRGVDMQTTSKADRDPNQQLRTRDECESRSTTAPTGTVCS